MTHKASLDKHVIESNNNEIITNIIKCIFEFRGLSHHVDNRRIIFSDLSQAMCMKVSPIDLSIYEADSHSKFGYGKYPICEYKSLKFPFSIWLFKFDQSQKTIIHDHKIDCLTTIISETPMIEQLYQIKSLENREVCRNKEEVYRLKGHVREDHLETSFVHRLKNPHHQKPAFTLHMYYMPIFSVKMELNSSVNKFFTKEKKLDELISR